MKTIQIQYDFDASRVYVSREYLENERTPNTLKLDMLMAEFRYEVEKAIIKLREEYEEKLNHTTS